MEKLPIIKGKEKNLKSYQRLKINHERDPMEVSTHSFFQSMTLLNENRNKKKII